MEQFSQDWSIFKVVTYDKPKLATKHELDTVYTVSDLYDFLEIIDTNDAIEKIAEQKAKNKAQAEKEKGKNKRQR